MSDEEIRAAALLAATQAAGFQLPDPADNLYSQYLEDFLVLAKDFEGYLRTGESPQKNE